jgi:hypothetical protein
VPLQSGVGNGVGNSISGKSKWDLLRNAAGRKGGLRKALEGSEHLRFAVEGVEIGIGSSGNTSQENKKLELEARDKEVSGVIRPKERY